MRYAGHDKLFTFESWAVGGVVCGAEDGDGGRGEGGLKMIGSA